MKTPPEESKPDVATIPPGWPDGVRSVYVLRATRYEEPEPEKLKSSLADPVKFRGHERKNQNPWWAGLRKR